MRNFIPLLAALLLSVSVGNGQSVSASPEFTAFAELARTAAEKQGAKILVQYDPAKRLLQVAQEFQVNPFRKMTQVQSVTVDKLGDEAEIDAIGNAAEPWLKIYCRDRKKNVQLDATQEVNGAPDEELARQERRPFLTLPCHPAELRKVQSAYAAFKKSASR